jgi:hypothetical protein
MANYREKLQSGFQLSIYTLCNTISVEKSFVLDMRIRLLSIQGMNPETAILRDFRGFLYSFTKIFKE